MGAPQAPPMADEDLAFITAQHLFFVATAPSGSDGRVNLSPKGLDTFRVLDRSTVAYLDITGSGAETIAHVRDNGRITVMFCSVEAKPNILRLYGRGEVLLPGTAAFDALRGEFGEHAGVRSIIRVAVESVSNSCGYGIPRYDYLGERPTLERWAESQGEEGLVAYRARRNSESIDGLPALRTTAS